MHHGGGEVGEAVVNLQLDDFRVDHHEAQFLRRKTEEQRGNDGVDADRLARAGGTGDEQVRHLGQVGDDRLAVDVLAECERNLGLGFFPLGRVDDVAEEHLGLDAVRHLDADGAAAGDGGEDVDVLGLDGGGDVVGQGGDALEPDAGRGVQLVAGDGRPLGDVALGDVDIKLLQRVLEQACVGEKLLAGLGGDGGGLGLVE